MDGAMTTRPGLGMKSILDKVALGDSIEKVTFEQRFEESKV